MYKLLDVAEKAGVSLSTASLILNGKGKFSDEVRARVLRAADQLGYQKNVFASAIAAGRVSHVGILVHEDYEKAFEWHFVRQMIIAIEAVVTEAGYFPIIVPVSFKQDTGEVFEKIVASGAGAIFSIHYARRELFRMLEDRGVPTVLVNNGSLQNEFCTVCVDDFQGSYTGTSHLIQLGHKRIGYLDYPRPDQSAIYADRFIGYRKAIEEGGCSQDPGLRETVVLGDQEDILGKLQSMVEGSRPTALFVHDDYLAAFVYSALVSLGLEVPKDISMIAPGDTLDYNYPFIPRISTMAIDTAMLGRLAGEMVVKRLAGEMDRMTVLKVTEQLVERGSCAAPARGAEA